MTEQEGARERKRRETRTRLTQAAKALFLEHGFACTTIDAIVEAAGISRRSFFHYFASKEDVVVAWQDEFEAALVAAVAARPDDEPLGQVAEEALIAAVSQMDSTEAVALARLKHDTPELRARDQTKYVALERALADALLARLARLDPGADPLPARLTAMMAVGVLRVAGEAWLTQSGDEPPNVYARRMFATIRASGSPNRPAG